MKTNITILGLSSAELVLKCEENKTIYDISLKDLAKLYEECLSALRNEAFYQKMGFIDFVNKLLESE
jgi:hypothetical protein